ncbi:uncharacterized protein [Rutidosis leptorrhynchoides]|uniref:uncharacterized protein n=1 Tax=Rutidosis leptorrhynchoides TaxID=125765 RepID=UPI003A9A57A2
MRKRVSVNSHVSKELSSKSKLQKGHVSDTRPRVNKSKVQRVSISHEEGIGAGLRDEDTEPEDEAQRPTEEHDDYTSYFEDLEEHHNQADRPRGPTLMRQIWKQKSSIRIPIVVNEHGQPIGANSSKFTHFLGHLSRSYQYCPIYRPWNKVKPEKKNKLLKFLRTKFDIPPTADSWIIQSYGRKMKNWRARVKDCFFDQSKPIEAQLKSPPLELTKRHWIRLLEYWTRDNVMEMTEKNKANRAKKKLSQLMGKKSFARIREELKVSLGREPTRVDMFKECYSNGSGEGEATRAFKKMKKLTEKLGEGATNAPRPDDVFVTIMGKAKNGTAEMYGLGVRANHFWGAGPQQRK